MTFPIAGQFRSRRSSSSTGSGLVESLERRWLMAITQPIYVSPAGSATPTPGDVSKPFTLSGARDYIRANKGTMSQNIDVLLAGGRYTLTSTLAFTPADSGNNGFEINYKAQPGSGTPKISGGEAVTGWAYVNGSSDLAVANISDTAANTREYFSNDIFRTRARTADRIVGKRWQLDSAGKPIGIVINNSDLPQTFSKVAGMEIHLQYNWRDYYIPITSISAPAPGGERVILLNTAALDAAQNLNDAFNYNAPFFVENAIELLDNYIEWYADPVTDKIYSKIPDLSVNQRGFVPILNNLITITGTGTSGTGLVNGLNFSGLTFEHAGNTTPNGVGWFGYQVTWYVKGGPTAGISISRATNVSFSNNVIARMGAIGVDVNEYCNGLSFTGNVFTDLGDTSISVGRPGHTNGANVNRNTLVNDNVIYRVGRAFYGAAGITYFASQGTVIDHNHIESVPYSGISLGWYGGFNNRVTNNTIVNFLQVTRDGAGIYFYGPSGTAAARSQISGNYIHDGHGDPGGIYLDQNSSYIDVTSNVVKDAPKWLSVNSGANNHTATNNYADTLNQTLDKNATNLNIDPPTVLATPAQAGAQTIMNAAGLEPSYVSLLSIIPTGTNVAPTVSATVNGNTSTATIALTANALLSGTASDDGKPYNFLRTSWSQVSGPSGGWATFTDSRLLNTTAAFSKAGTYVIRFEADDGLAAPVGKNLTVTVTAVTLPTNLTLAATLTASSQYQGLSTYGPSKAGDGNINSGWAPDLSTESQLYLTADLGSTNSISRIEVVFRQDLNQLETRRDFVLLASNDPAFPAASTKTLGGYGGDAEAMPDKSTYTLNVGGTAGYRYVRWDRVHSNATFVAELRIFGTPASPPDTTAPTLSAAFSSKLHGGSGVFNLPLALGGATKTIEPRLNGANKLIFTFSEPILAADGTLSANEFVLTNASFGSATVSGNTLTLNLTGVVDRKYATIALTGLTDLAGNALTGAANLTVGNLYGDVSRNGLVSTTDQQLVKNALLQTVNATNFLLDANASGGFISVVDQQVIKNNLLHGLS